VNVMSEQRQKEQSVSAAGITKEK